MLLPGCAAAAEPAPETTSVTDWLCSAIFGRGWQLLTGADLLPSAAADGEGAALLDADPEAPSADEQTPAAAAGEIESLYSAEGKHTKQTGYYVKTVGNAPVAKPQALSVEQVVAAQASPAGAISGGSAWNALGTFETRDTTSWAKKRLPELSAACAVIQTLTADGGDASLAVVRGELRAGFCLELSISWAGGDCELEVLDTESAAELELPTAAPAELRAALASVLLQLKEEMVTQAG